MNAQFFDAWSPRILSLLRIVAGVLIFEHGTQKLFVIPAGPANGPRQSYSHCWAVLAF